MQVDRTVLECISKKVAHGYSELIEEEEAFKLNQNIEEIGTKTKIILYESCEFLQTLRAKLEPEYELVDLESDCRDINDLLNELAEDNDHLNSRLEIIKSSLN